MNGKAKETHLTLVAAGKRPGEHEWKPGADVQSVWKKFGWTPPSRLAVDYSKGSSPAKQPVLRIMRG